MEDHARLWPATLAALSGSVLVGVMPLIARRLYAEGIGAPSMLLWRYVLALVPLSIAIALLKVDVRAAWRGGAWQIAAIGATLGAGQTLCFWESLKTLDTSIAVLLFYTYPALTLALERLVFRRPIRKLAVGCIAVILCGAALITIPGLRAGTIDPRGLAWAIPSPLIYAVYLAATSTVLRRYPPLVGGSCLYIGMSATFAVGVAVVGFDMPTNAPTCWLLLFAALGPGALTITLFSFSVPKLGPSSYAIIANAELVTVVTIGVVLLGEAATPSRAVGGAMIVGGILTHALSRRATSTLAPHPGPLPARGGREGPASAGG
jgi:drug/metabolite transporter (DMT)-like permease